MPPGAKNNRGNRYALLASEDPKPKKQRTTEDSTNFFPALPSVVKADHKFIILSSLTNDKKMTDFSCFAVYKAIKAISSDVISISELRDGNLLLLVKNKTIVQKFLNTKELSNVGPVKFELHKTLNTTKGTIYAPYLNKVDDDEIVRELSSQGVTSVFKFTKNIEGKPVPSGVILLSFDLYKIPSKIEISWHHVKVREYIPNPMRCKSCQLLGHTAKWCKNTAVCEGCSLPPHQPEKCTRTMCANCFEPHPSSSNECLKYQQSKEILTIKIRNKCSMFEAKKIYQSQVTKPPIFSPTSYAAVLSTTVPSRSSTVHHASSSNITTNINKNKQTVANSIQNSKTSFQSSINDNNKSKVQSNNADSLKNINSLENINHSNDCVSKNNTYSYIDEQISAHNKSNEIISDKIDDDDDMVEDDYANLASNNSIDFSPLPNLSQILSKSQTSLLSDDYNK